MRTFKGLGSLKDSSETRVNPQTPSGILGNPQKPPGILGNHSRILGNLRELPEGNRPCTGLSLAARRNVSPYFYSFLFFSPSLYFFLSSLPFPLSFLLSVLVSVFPTLSLLSHSLLLFLILLLPPSAPLPSPPPFSHSPSCKHDRLMGLRRRGGVDGGKGGHMNIWIYMNICRLHDKQIGTMNSYTCTFNTHTIYMCVCPCMCVTESFILHCICDKYVSHGSSVFDEFNGWQSEPKRTYRISEGFTLLKKWATH